jgi:hypothetical protein
MNAFTWRVWANGYEWKEWRGLRYLSPRVVPMSGGGRREHQPGPALFREFAGTDPTPEGALLFANRYGLLLDPERSAPDGGGPHPEPGVYAVHFDNGDEHFVEHYESFDLWREQIDLLHQAVRIRDTGEGADQLVALVSDGLAGRVTPRFVQDPRTGRLELQVVPDNLLGALWLQLAEAIGGGKQFRQCAICGGWFEVSGRSDQRVCTQACRSKAYRARQDRARQLAAEGRGFPAIAKELGSNAKTVRKWVTGR